MECQLESSRAACCHALLHVIAQLAELFSLGSDQCLVLRGCAKGSLSALLCLACTVLLSGQLAFSALCGNREPELRNECSGLGTCDQAAQVGHRAATHALGLKSAGQFIQDFLGLVATRVQQHSGGRAFLRQHLVRKDQVTTTIGTTGDRASHMRLACAVLCLY